MRSLGPQLRPQHDYENLRWVFKGIHGSERVTVRLPEEKGGTTRILRAVATELEHVRVTVEPMVRDEKPARAAALRAAVAEAREKAEIMANASGAVLGPLRELREAEANAGAFGSHALAEAAPGGGETEFDPADVRVEAGVSGVWALLPGGTARALSSGAALKS